MEVAALVATIALLTNSTNVTGTQIARSPALTHEAYIAHAPGLYFMARDGPRGVTLELPCHAIFGDECVLLDRREPLRAGALLEGRVSKEESGHPFLASDG